MGTATESPLQAIIIGSGFGGLGMAISLKQAGYKKIAILEKAGHLGGCWRDNTYPGCECDIPSHLYSYSFEPKHDWSQKFPPQPEILDYIDHCANKYGINPLIQYNTEVKGARYLENEGLWQVTTKDGRVLNSHILISAVGQLSRPNTPNIKGQDAFQGKQFHSAQWDHNYDLTGKKVAVVGTGASAIQFIPEIAKQAAAVTVFQRSAAYVVKKPNRRYPKWEQRLYKTAPILQEMNRQWIYWTNELRLISLRNPERLDKMAKKHFLKLLKDQISDKELRKRLTPNYVLGCKRALMSNDYYPTFLKPHVKLVNDGVSHMTKTGISDDQGNHHKVDAIIYGTGFKATEFLSPMEIHGVDGQELNQAWKEGAEAYLGITVNGFPNLFMLYGPNTNLGHSSIIFMLEKQIKYITKCAQYIVDHDVKSFNVKASVQNKYNQFLADLLKDTIWTLSCHSWYKNEFGKITNNWPTYTFIYEKMTKIPDWQDYKVNF